MAKSSENECRLEVTIQSVELKQGKKEPWAKVQGYYAAEDRDRNPLQVPIRFTAFGVLAERCASVEGQEVQVRLAAGGYRGADGRVWPDFTCQSVSRPWGETGGAAPAKRTAPAAPPQYNEEDPPF